MKKMLTRGAVFLFLAANTVGCDDDDAGSTGKTDAGKSDAGQSDASHTDAAHDDAAQADAGQTDGEQTEAGPSEAGPSDSGQTDAGQTDGSRSDAGQTTDGSTQSAACLANATNDYRVRIQGSGFGAHDGKTLHAVTRTGLLSAQAICQETVTQIIDQGSFDARLTNQTDTAIYRYVGAFVDINDNGDCDEGTDLLWSTAVAITPGNEFTYTLTPDQFSTQDVSGFGLCSWFAGP